MALSSKKVPDRWYKLSQQDVTSKDYTYNLFKFVRALPKAKSYFHFWFISGTVVSGVGCWTSTLQANCWVIDNIDM